MLAGLLGLFDVDFVYRFGVCLFFFEADPFVAGGLAPGGHVFFDAFVVGEDFEDLAGGEFLDFLGGENDGHGAEVPQRIECDVGLDHVLNFPSPSPSPCPLPPGERVRLSRRGGLLYSSNKQIY